MVGANRLATRHPSGRLTGDYDLDEPATYIRHTVRFQDLFSHLVFASTRLEMGHKMEFIVVFVLYLLGGLIVGNLYYRRRHGVAGNLGWGWSGQPGQMAAAVIAATWPVAIFLPSTRKPQLCRHRDHILARDESRRLSGAASEAYRREMGE